MATTLGKTQCVTCGKEKAAYKCEGCSKHFCFDHLADHRQLLMKQVDEAEDKRNVFQQTLLEQAADPRQQRLVQQINQWEKESIDKIQQAADEARQLVTQNTAGHFNGTQSKLTTLTEELRQIRHEKDFNEIHLNELKRKLEELIEQFDKPTNISIRLDNSSTFISKISVSILPEKPIVPNINVHVRWEQKPITVAGGNGEGNELNQLNNPWSVYVDDDQTIYVADRGNHRIVEWKKGATSGRIVAGGNGPGRQNNQLDCPVNVIKDKKNDALIICDYGNKRVMRWPCRENSNGEVVISNVVCCGSSMDDDGCIYVSDIDKHEVRRWRPGETSGALVAGGRGKGNGLDQLNYPSFIFVDQDQSVYVSDCSNNRVMKWMKGARYGMVVAGNQNSGVKLTELSHPRGTVVDRWGTVYVADAGNRRVMCWLTGASEGSTVVHSHRFGKQPSNIGTCLGLSFDEQNNLYLVDQERNRVHMFQVVHS